MKAWIEEGSDISSTRVTMLMDLLGLGEKVFRCASMAALAAAPFFSSRAVMIKVEVP